jgi:hypothetical protein
MAVQPLRNSTGPCSSFLAINTALSFCWHDHSSACPWSSANGVVDEEAVFPSTYIAYAPCVSPLVTMSFPPTSSSASSTPSIDSSLWNKETKWHMEIGLESPATGEKRYRPGWLQILRELFPSPMFSVAPWSYKEASRTGADHEVCILIRIGDLRE